MPSNASVIIEYGPYNSQGIIEYKIERLQGLQSKLNFSKIQTFSIKINFKNRIPRSERT